MSSAPEWLKWLNRSIEHWERVVTGEDILVTRAACSLCTKYHDNEQCTGCPVKERTGESGCMMTPYTEVDIHLYTHRAQGRDRFEIHCDECAACKTFSRAMLEFLKGLRPVEASDVQSV